MTAGLQSFAPPSPGGRECRLQIEKCKLKIENCPSLSRRVRGTRLPLPCPFPTRRPSPRPLPEGEEDLPARPTDNPRTIPGWDAGARFRRRAGRAGGLRRPRHRPRRACPRRCRSSSSRPLPPRAMATWMRKSVTRAALAARSAAASTLTPLNVSTTPKASASSGFKTTDCPKAGKTASWTLATISSSITALEPTFRPASTRPRRRSPTRPPRRGTCPSRSCGR